MKVQLFNPPVHHYSGVHYKMNPPLSLPIIAAAVTIHIALIRAKPKG